MAASRPTLRSGWRAGFEPLLLDFPKAPWDDPEEVRRVIEQEDPDTIAAFIVEPITGASGGCFLASDEYWATVVAGVPGARHPADR